jgi:zinc protease
MRVEFARMHESGPTEEETDLARSYYTGSFPLGYASAGGKLYQVTVAERYRLGTDWLDAFPEHVEALSRADLARAAQTRLHPDDLLMVVIGNVTKEDLDLPDAVWIE